MLLVRDVPERFFFVELNVVFDGRECGPCADDSGEGTVLPEFLRGGGLRWCWRWCLKKALFFKALCDLAGGDSEEMLVVVSARRFDQGVDVIFLHRDLLEVDEELAGVFLHDLADEVEVLCGS